jgi:hypothetical protein
MNPYTFVLKYACVSAEGIHSAGVACFVSGTTKIMNLDSNIDSLGVSLTKEEMEQLEAAVPIHEVAGERYMEGILEKTWRYMSTPPLESWKPTSAGV